jgi:hypothetical protein
MKKILQVVAALSDDDNRHLCTSQARLRFQCVLFTRFPQPPFGANEKTSHHVYTTADGKQLKLHRIAQFTVEREKQTNPISRDENSAGLANYCSIFLTLKLKLIRLSTLASKQHCGDATRVSLESFSCRKVIHPHALTRLQP